MSLSSILNNASSALLNSQAQINVVSQNIGNAQNPNYSQRNVVTSDTAPAQGGGSTIISVQRAVDTTLQAEYLNQTSDTAAKNTTQQLYTQLEQMTGASNQTPILVSAMQTFQSAWQALQASPEDAATKTQVVNSAQSLVSTLQTVSNGVEQLAGQVTTQLNTDVSTLNTSLTQIANLNVQIVREQANGQNTSDLEDSRDQLITTVAGLVPVQQTRNPDGSIYLTTPSGVGLVQVAANSFAYNAVTGTFYTVGDPDETPLNGALTTGSIGAELGILSNNPSDINSPAAGSAPLQKLRDQLNGIADLFYASPPATPTAFQAAYDNAAPANPGEQANSFFTMTAPSGSSSDRFSLEVNPLLVDGTSTVKQSAATPVANLLTAPDTTFSAGGIATNPTSFVGVANAVTADQSNRAALAKTDQTSATANLSAAQQAYRNVTGVNSDQQLAQLITLQNAYAAAAKMLSTVQQLEQTLMSAVGQ